MATGVYLHTGTLHTKEEKTKISLAMIGKHNSPKTEFKKGVVFSEEVKRKMSLAKMGEDNVSKRPEVREKISIANTGVKHYRWNSNREIVRHNRRNDGEYLQWVKAVKKRDGKICQLKDETCKGYMVAAHIKGWALYPNERYNINNGITLCQRHHPKTRSEDQRLIPVFQELISQMN